MTDTPSLIAADAIIALGRAAKAARDAGANIADPLAVAILSDIATTLHDDEGALTARLRAFVEAQGQVDRVGRG